MIPITYDNQRQFLFIYFNLIMVNNLVFYSANPTGSSFSGQGKVRRMFEDRRSTGYDKSYPLHPLNKSPPLHPLNKSPATAPASTRAPPKGVVRNGARGLSSDRYIFIHIYAR